VVILLLLYADHRANGFEYARDAVNIGFILLRLMYCVTTVHSPTAL